MSKTTCDIPKPDTDGIRRYGAFRLPEMVDRCVVEIPKHGRTPARQCLRLRQKCKYICVYHERKRNELLRQNQQRNQPSSFYTTSSAGTTATYASYYGSSNSSETYRYVTQVRNL